MESYLIEICSSLIHNHAESVKLANHIGINWPTADEERSLRIHADMEAQYINALVATPSVNLDECRAKAEVVIILIDCPALAASLATDVINNTPRKAEKELAFVPPVAVAVVGDDLSQVLC